MPSQPPPYVLPMATIKLLSLQLRIIPIVMPVQYVQGPLHLPHSPPSQRPPCIPPLMTDLSGSYRGSTPSLQPSLNWGPTHPRAPPPRTLTPPQTVLKVTQMEVSVLSWRTPAPTLSRRPLGTSTTSIPASVNNRSRKRKRENEKEPTRQQTRSRDRRSPNYMPTPEMDWLPPPVSHSPSLMTTVLSPRPVTTNFTLTIPSTTLSAPPLARDIPSTLPSSSLPWYQTRRTTSWLPKPISSQEENPLLKPSPTPPPT